MDPRVIFERMSQETFEEVIGKSPRSVREVLFSRFAIKAKAKIGLKNIAAKKRERARKLHDRLKLAGGEKEQEVGCELIRNWLFSHRAMLKSALDFLGIANDDGLVEEETDFFSQLSKEKIKELVLHLGKSFPPEEIEIYLMFVEVPHLDDALKK